MNRRRFLLGSLMTALTGIAGGAWAVTRPPNPYHRGPVSDHFDGIRFFNPGGTPPRGFGDLLRWQFGGGR